MLRRLARFVLGISVLAGVVGSAVVIGMRRRTPVVVDAVRLMNKRMLNPQQMESAGTEGAYASIIRHVGRNTGAHYETPVGVRATDAGFVIMLPYGRRADWLQNVLAAGTATLVHEGHTYEVDTPRLVPLQEATGPTDQDRQAAKLFAITEVLELRNASSG